MRLRAFAGLLLAIGFSLGLPLGRNDPDPALTLYYDFVGSSSLSQAARRGPPLTFTRASSRTCWDASGTLVTLSADTPCFDHDPSNGNAPLGLSSEKSNTNIAKYSEDATQWGKSASTVVVADQVTAPDGTLTADEVSVSWIQASRAETIPAGTVFVGSLFVKKKSDGVFQARIQSANGSERAPVTFNLDTGVATPGTPVNATYVDSGLIQLPNGWWRLWVAGSLNTLDTASLYLSGFTDLYVWGMDIKTGSYPTSYIATGATSVTRAAPAITTSDLSWFNDNEGTFYIDFDGWWGDDYNVSPFRVGQTSHRLWLNLNGYKPLSTNGWQFGILDGGVGQGNVYPGDVTPGSRVQIAMSYRVGRMAAAASYASGITEDTSGTSLPAKADLPSLQVGVGPGGWNINGHAQAFRYWNVEKPDAWLQSVTTAYIPAFGPMYAANDDEPLQLAVNQ